MAPAKRNIDDEIILAFFAESDPEFPSDGLDAPPDIDAFKRAGEQAEENIVHLRNLKVSLENAISTMRTAPALVNYQALQNVITEVVTKQPDLFEPELPVGSYFTDFSRKGISNPVVRKTGASFLKARQFYDDLNEVLTKALGFSLLDLPPPGQSNGSGGSSSGGAVNPATQNAIREMREEVKQVREGQLELIKKTKSTIPVDSRLAKLMALKSLDDPLYTTEYKTARTTAYYAHLSSASKGHEIVMEKFSKFTDRQMSKPHVSEGRLVHEDGLRLHDHFLHIESLLKTSLVTYFPDIVSHLSNPNAGPLVHDPRDITLIECMCRTLGTPFLNWWRNQNFPPYHRAVHDYKTFKLILILQFTPQDTDKWSKDELERHCQSYVPGRTPFAAWYHRIQQLQQINYPAQAGYEITKAYAFQCMRQGLPPYIEKEFRRLHYTHETPDEEIRHVAIAEEHTIDTFRQAQGHSNPAYGTVNALHRDRRHTSSPRRLNQRKPHSRTPPRYRGSLRAMNAEDTDDNDEECDPCKEGDFVHSGDEFCYSDSGQESGYDDLSPEEVDNDTMAKYNLNVIDSKSPTERQAFLSNKNYTFRCYHCNEVGHYKRDCPHLSHGRDAQRPRTFRNSGGMRSGRSGPRRYFRQSSRTMQILEVKGASDAAQAIDILSREGRTGDLLMIREGNEYFALA